MRKKSFFQKQLLITALSSLAFFSCTTEETINLTEENQLESTNQSLVTPQSGKIYTIQSRDSGRFLDIANKANNSGANLQIWGTTAIEPHTHRQWEVINIEDNYVRLKGVDSGKSLEVAGASKTNGANIQQWVYEGGAHQQWEILPTDSGYFRIKNRNSGKSLDVFEGKNYDGTNVQQWSYATSLHQQWMFIEVPSDETLDPDPGTEVIIDETISDLTPYDVLGSVITDWKITYPVDKNNNDSSDADDCDDRNRNAYEQLDLTKEISSTHSKYFFVSDDEVVFKAHVGGATTSGSSYPRSEFRQLVGGGNNYWKMKDYQSLEVRVRATNLPKVKPEVSMVQIHGPDDEPLRVEYRSDSQGLHVVQNEDTTKTYVLDYKLGQQLFVKVTVDDGKITLYILNEDTGKDYTDSWIAEDSTGYFKVGCYTQSNNNLETCKPGEGYKNQDADEYGEVRIKDLKLVETY